MLSKCRQPLSSQQSAKRMCSTTFSGSSTSASAPVNPPDNNSIARLSLSDLTALSANTLRTHLQSNKLSSIGNKVTMASRLDRFLHPAVASPSDTLSVPRTAPSTTAIEPTSTSTVNVPLQVIEQLSTFFQQFNHQAPQQSNDTPSAIINDVPANNPADADEILSAASEQIELSTVPVRVQSTTTVQSLLPPTPVQPTNTQTSILPFPPRIRDRIICGKFIEFPTLLPKAMFAGM